METVQEIFMRVLDPADVSAGGGSGSAIAGAMAGALLAMFCRLPVEERAAEAGMRAEAGAHGAALGQVLQQGSAADREAYAGVRSAYQLPRASDAERAERSRAVQAAWLRAAEVPLDNGGLCWQLLQLAQQLEGRTNPNALSDLRCAQLLARAGLLGCLENVAINLPMIKDAAAQARLAARAAELRGLLDALPENQNIS